MLDADLALLNKDQATYCPVHRPEYSATLDLALASLDLASSVLSCEVSDELRSDHLSLVLEIESSLPDLATNTTTTISSIDLPEFVERANKATDSLDRKTQPTEEGIDIAVNNLTEAIARARAAATRTKVINLKNNKLNILPPHVVELLKSEDEPELSPLPTNANEARDIIGKVRQHHQKNAKTPPPIYHQNAADIFNAYVCIAHLPSPWKEAAVVMLPKPKKDHSLPSSYRPISLLNTLSKILFNIFFNDVVNTCLQLYFFNYTSLRQVIFESRTHVAA